MILNDNEYEIIAGEQQWGNEGSLGVRVQLGGTRSKGLTKEDKRELENVTYPAIKEIQEKITELLYAKDPAKIKEAQTQRENIENCFSGENIYMEEEENGYCSRGCCKHLPWFKVTTRIGHFTVGWRRRVIVLDWTNTENEHDAEVLFPEVDTTKDGNYIHAWSYGDLQSFIARIISTSGSELPCPPEKK